jgi:hypothetical protein
MSTRLTGSIDVTMLVNMAKAKHSSMNVSQKNGKLYANVTVWLNDEPDDNGNIMSMVLNGKQISEAADLALNNGKKAYVANAKYPKAKEGGTAAAFTDLNLDMGAYGQPAANAQQSTPPWQQQSGQQTTNDLPF